MFNPFNALSHTDLYHSNKRQLNVDFSDLGNKITNFIDKNKTTDIWIVEICDEIKNLLLKKNKDYGDSALNPKRIFSNISPMEQLFVRIDDKLSRINNLKNKVNEVKDETIEDTIKDLIGYCILCMIQMRKQRNSEDV